MKTNLRRMYCVYDCVAFEASAPFIQKNHGCARRAFEKLMRETGVAGSDDFELYYIGTFDSDTMDVKQDEYTCIMTSKEVKKVVNETVDMFPAEVEERRSDGEIE